MGGDSAELHFPARHGVLHDWHNCATHKIIWDEVSTMRSKGISTAPLLRKPPTGDADQDRKRREEARRNLQAAITKDIGKKEQFHPHYRIRNKLARWHLPGTPRLQGEGFHRFLQLIRENHAQSTIGRTQNCLERLGHQTQISAGARTGFHLPPGLPGHGRRLP